MYCFKDFDSQPVVYEANDPLSQSPNFLTESDERRNQQTRFKTCSLIRPARIQPKD